MKPDEVVSRVEAAYETNWKSENLVDSGQFRKGGGESWTLRTSIVRRIAAEEFKSLRTLEKDELFELCEALLVAGYSTIAFDWARRVEHAYEPVDLEIFESWLRRHVLDWGDCDDLCTGPLGLLINRFPELAKRTKSWTGAAEWWVRRGAAVSLIPALRRGVLLVEAFAVADRLLMDGEDLVKKGYGWMLKEGTRKFHKEVLAFVMERKHRMPRTALRYAIEKLPPGERRAAMSR